MKKRSVRHACRLLPWILALWLLWPGRATAQTYTAFIDQFSPGTQGWLTGSTALHDAAIREDFYYLSRKHPRAGRVFVKYLTQDLSGYYELETAIEMLHGDDAVGVGFVFDFKDPEHYRSLLYSTQTKLFSITEKDGPAERTLKAWTPAPALRGGARENKFRLRRNGDSLTVFINDRHTTSIKAPAPACGAVGYVINGVAMLRSDYTLVRYFGDIKTPAYDPAKYKREKVEGGINTPLDEHQPIISADGNTLYFTREGMSAIYPGETDCDIWYSQSKGGGQWGGPSNLGPPLNDYGRNAVFSVTSDNNTLMVYAPLDPLNFSFRRPLFALSQKGRGGWKPPVPQIISDGYTFHRFISGNLSPDGKCMLLGMERNTGEGDADLFVCFNTGPNQWSAPLNLGPVVNGPGLEHDPFLAPDGKTLYFTSDSHPGYGGFDVFMTRRLDDSWTRWSEPVNLGPAFNTASDDEEFVLAADGAFAYLSSEVSKNNRDIFRIKVPDALKPLEMVVLNGKLAECETGKPLSFAINWTDLDNPAEKGVLLPRSADGSYSLVLQPGHRYVFQSSPDGKNYYYDTVATEAGGETQLNTIFKLCNTPPPVYLPQEIKERPVTFQEGMQVKHKKVTLAIWDDEMEDGDIISLNVNGKWVLENYMLTRARHEIEIELKESGNYLVMYAHSEGASPPNTAAISIIDGDEEHELTLNSSLQHSGAITLEVKGH